MSGYSYFNYDQMTIFDVEVHSDEEDVELFSSVNPRNKKEIENPAKGIAKITKHSNVQCIAGHNMVFLSKDYNMDAYIFGCPVLNEEARKKVEHMGMEIPEQCECEKNEECCPNSEIGRIYRACLC